MHNIKLFLHYFKLDLDYFKKQALQDAHNGGWQNTFRFESRTLSLVVRVCPLGVIINI